MNNSISSENVVLAFNLGYRADENGNIISPFSGKFRALNKDTKGYYRFSIKENKIMRSVYVHQLQAYQKFGRDALQDEIVVRHLDGQSTNNSIQNIEIGSVSDNRMDIPKTSRIAQSLFAAEFTRSLNKEEVDQLRLDRKNGMKYRELKEKYNIAMSTISYIVNNKTYQTI